MAGRPRKYKDAAQVQALVEGYFESCFEDKFIKDEKGEVVEVQRVQIRPFTITGLALALDMTREMLLDYQNTDEFGDTIKKAKMRCHNFAEEQLFTNKSAAGVIFNLKNNYGWRDKTEVDSNISGALEINVNVVEE